MRFTSILFTCVLCFLEAKSSTEDSLEISNESLQSEALSDESGLSISIEFQSAEKLEGTSTEKSLSVSNESIEDDSEYESVSSISFEEESEDVSNDSTLDTSSHKSLEVSSEFIKDDDVSTEYDPATRISFELQSAGESEDVSDISNDSSDASFSSEIVKNGVIDNDQVYCSWEDVNARDEMATKLGTQLCRFSMVSFTTGLMIQ